MLRTTLIAAVALVGMAGIGHAQGRDAGGPRVETTPRIPAETTPRTPVEQSVTTTRSIGASSRASTLDVPGTPQDTGASPAETSPRAPVEQAPTGTRIPG